MEVAPGLGLAPARFGDKRPFVASLASGPLVSAPEVPFCARADGAGVSPASEWHNSSGKRRRLVVHLAGPLQATTTAGLGFHGHRITSPQATAGLGSQGHTRTRTQAAAGGLGGSRASQSFSPSSSLGSSLQKLPNKGKKLRGLRNTPGRGLPSHDPGSWLQPSSLAGRVFVCVAIREAQEPSCDQSQPHGSLRGFPWLSGVKQVRGLHEVTHPLVPSPFSLLSQTLGNRFSNPSQGPWSLRSANTIQHARVLREGRTCVDLHCTVQDEA